MYVAAGLLIAGGVLLLALIVSVRQHTKAAERLRQAEENRDAADRVGRALVDAPRDRDGVLDRVRDTERKL